MRSPRKSENPRHARLIHLAFAAACATTAFAVSAQDDELRAVRAMIEGVFALEAWHVDGKVFNPPQVEGRVVYLNGATMFIVHNRMRESPQVSAASWGDYTLSRTEFAYRYTEPATFSIASSGITHARRLPWEGYRTFAVQREGNTVRLTAKAGSQEFLFTPTSLVFTEGVAGASLTKRVYRRVATQ